MINASFRRPENCGRRCEVMAGASGLQVKWSGLDAVVVVIILISFLDNSIYSDCAYFHPGVEKDTKNLILG